MDRRTKESIIGQLEEAERSMNAASSYAGTNDAQHLPLIYASVISAINVLKGAKDELERVPADD